MKKFIVFVSALLLFSSCVEEQVAPQQENNETKRHLRSLLKTKSSPLSPADSLKILSVIQSDLDNLMLGRVIMKNGKYILSVKKEDALFLGVSEVVYNKYIEYVDNLNASLY